MMKVKTKLGISSIPNAGIGLFADEFIPKGAIVWEYDGMYDQILTESKMQAANPLDKTFLEMYCFKYKGEYCLCVDNARFFNHLPKEEATCIDEDYGLITNGVTRANKDINPGEELTCDYADFGLIEDKEFNTTL